MKGKTTRESESGFSLVEAVMSIVLVAVMFAAVMQTVGAGRMAHYKTSGQRRGSLLARQLLAEVLQQAYEDPDTPTVTLGIDTGESASDRGEGKGHEQGQVDVQQRVARDDGKRRIHVSLTIIQAKIQMSR